MTLEHLGVAVVNAVAIIGAARMGANRERRRADETRTPEPHD